MGRPLTPPGSPLPAELREIVEKWRSIITAEFRWPLDDVDDLRNWGEAFTLTAAGHIERLQDACTRGEGLNALKKFNDPVIEMCIEFWRRHPERSLSQFAKPYQLIGNALINLAEAIKTYRENVENALIELKDYLDRNEAPAWHTFGDADNAIHNKAIERVRQFNYEVEGYWRRMSSTVEAAAKAFLNARNIFERLLLPGDAYQKMIPVIEAVLG